MTVHIGLIGCGGISRSHARGYLANADRVRVTAVADVGKHILCEKPLCLTLAEANRISRAVAANGVTLMCAHNILYLPAVTRARELLAAGVLGRPR